MTGADVAVGANMQMRAPSAACWLKWYNSA